MFFIEIPMILIFILIIALLCGAVFLISILAYWAFGISWILFVTWTVYIEYKFKSKRTNFFKLLSNTIVLITPMIGLPILRILLCFSKNYITYRKLEYYDIKMLLSYQGYQTRLIAILEMIIIMIIATLLYKFLMSSSDFKKMLYWMRCFIYTYN